MKKKEPKQEKKKLLMLGYGWYAKRGEHTVVLEKMQRDGVEVDSFTILSVQRVLHPFREEYTPFFKAMGLRGFSRYLRPLYDILSVCTLPFLVLVRERFVPTILVIYDPSLIFATLLFRIVYKTPVIFFMNNLPRDLATTRKFSILRVGYYRWCESFLAHRVDRVCVINETTKSYVESIGVEKENIRVVLPDTIQRDEEYRQKAKKGAVRKKFAISPEDKILLSVGRLEREKNHKALFPLLKEMSHTVLFLCGEGGLEQELRRNAHSCGVSERVFFVGNVGRNEIWDFFADADLFILLSTSEALGLVFLEAMSMRVPVVGSVASGILETIGESEERGYLCRGGGECVEKIQTVLAGGASVAEKVERAYAYVHALQKERNTLTKVIEELCVH